MVPGHECLGQVLEIGETVAECAVGETVAVGYVSGSCMTCEWCKSGVEQFCPSKEITFNWKDPSEKTISCGAFATEITADARFVVKLSNADPRMASLLCAGLTVYSPLRHFGMLSPAFRLGVAGCGGLGHVAVKIAKAHGAEVTVISRSPSKRARALDELKADHFLLSTDEGAMAAKEASLDGILDACSGPHSLDPLLSLLRPDSRLVLVGMPSEAVTFSAPALIMRRLSVSGSFIGSMADLRALVALAEDKPEILPDAEVLPAAQANEALSRLRTENLDHRLVLDCAALASLSPAMA
mmetsp:Transcript_22950/g.74766  ORF Transcript_22950/g.74766 Transcript_22950/m.74766 type:complete len:298 (-) Transcript_22950:186-1079(-)